MNEKQMIDIEKAEMLDVIARARDRIVEKALKEGESDGRK